MKFSVRDNMLQGMTLDQKFSLLEGIGYDGIELVGRDELGDKVSRAKEILPSYRLKVSTLSGYRGDLISPNPLERRLAISDIEERLGWASELGAVGLIVVPTFGSLKLPDLMPYASAYELERSLLISELKGLSKISVDKGVRVILEPLNRYETHFLNTLDQGYAIAEEAGEGVSIMADFFHMNIEEPDMAEAIRRNFKRLAHVHLADSNRLEPGKGHTNFVPSLKALGEMGYNGYGALECSLSEEPEKSLSSALSYVRSQLRGAHFKRSIDKWLKEGSSTSRKDRRDTRSRWGST